MSSKRPSIYWDSCVFIDVLQKTPDRYPDLRKIITEGENGRLVIVTSAFTLAEVFKVADSADDAAKQAETIHSLFETDFIEIWSVDRAVGEMAGDISRNHKGVLSGDAVHLATAIQSGV